MQTTPDAASPRYQALLQLLATADAIWNASRVFFDRWTLGPSQFNVLNLLHLQPEGLSQSELSRRLIMHRSNLTGLVDRLEQRGLVERQDVAEDRRAYRVSLTAKGRKVVEEILPGYYEKADQVLRHLSPHRARQLADELVRMAENAKRLAAELPQ
jgi:DNA-binding MarR family transcriptional regulator